MTSNIFRTATAATLLAVAGLPLLAADPVVTPGHTFRAKQVLGTKILMKNNTAVGTVEDLVFDEAGNLEYMIVSSGENKLMTLPWDAAKFDMKKIPPTATVNLTPEVYKSIPTYTPTTYPNFYTPKYRTETYKFYGLTPRELRRLDRRIP